MKKALLLLPLLAAALAGCVRKEVVVAEEKAQSAEQMRQNDLAAVGKQRISVLMKGYEYSYVQVLCVDGTSYVTFRDTITPHVSPETGKPISCEDKLP